MDRSSSDPQATFNQLYKEMDEIYHAYAKRHGVSDTALWLLYSLCENRAACTQKELCSAWHYPPQTINSALKRLEKQGLVTLRFRSENHKNKWVMLTEAGKTYAQAIIAPLIAAEQRTFQGLKKTERETLVALTQKYAILLRDQINEI